MRPAAAGGLAVLGSMAVAALVGLLLATTASEPFGETSPRSSLAGAASGGLVLDDSEEADRRRRRWPRPRARPPLALPQMPIEGGLTPPAPHTRDGVPYEFYFTRVAYSGWGFQGFASWSIDYPKADRQFLIGVQRLVNHLDAYSYEHPIQLTDPRLRDFPFLYAVEVGFMSLSDEEVLGLRSYLEAGGFLVIDDFWGTREMSNLVLEMGRVLPNHRIVDVPLDHPVFHCFYDVTELVQVPNLAKGQEMALGIPGATTWEKDGYTPHVKGVFDDRGRLMVAINWNSDLGDAWEWAENALYPLEYSTYAYQMGVNYIVYAMTH